MASASTSTRFRASDSSRRSRSPRSPTSPSSASAQHMYEKQGRPRASTSTTHHRSRQSQDYSEYRPCSSRGSSRAKEHLSYASVYPRDHLKASTSKQQRAQLRITPDPPTLLAFAFSFQTLLDSQAPISSTHSAYSELLSVSSSNFPPSTLPISALSDLIHSNATPSTSSSSKSSFSSVSTSLLDSNMAGGVTTTAGLDLLGILAEEVDWDPQQPGGAPHLAVQSHHEAKQKLWAGQILGSLGLIEPDGSRRGSFATLTGSAMPKVDAGTGKMQQKHSRKVPGLAEDPLNTMTLTKRTALFYENLYERLCPAIVPRAYIYPKLGRKSHDQDPTFATLALSISLLGLLGLTLPSSPAKAADGNIETELRRSFVMPSGSSSDKRSRTQDPEHLYSEARNAIERILLLRLSSSGGGICFGQTPTLETVLTSFFLSLALYNLDDGAGFTEWKDASFFRFCEAVTLAKILGLDQIGASTPATVAVGEASEEVKVWMLLVRAERWWAEQKAGYVCQMEARADAGEVNRKRVKTDDEFDAPVPLKRQRRSEMMTAEPLDFLTKLGFEGVRDDLLHCYHDLLDCWTGRCNTTSSCRLTSDAAVRIHDSLASLELSSHVHLAADPILVDLARQTLRAKLWIACLHHDLVSTLAQGPLRPDQPLHIALDTLDLLEDLDQLVLRSLPTDAVASDAVREALQEIRDCVGTLPNGRFAGESFSFEQIDESDESDEPSEGGHAGERASSTTITRAAQSVMDNLDRFLGRAVAH